MELETREAQEETTTITSPEDIKPKNPKKVEQGIRLSEWNRQAKSRRKTPKSYANSTIFILTGIGVALVGVGVYFKDKIKNVFKSNDEQLINLDAGQEEVPRVRKTFNLD